MSLTRGFSGLTNGFVLAAVMALAAAIMADGQTYTFSSCKNAVTLTIKIDSFIQKPVSNSIGGGQHGTTYIFTGDYVFTANGSTQTYSSVISGGALNYTTAGNNLTEFMLQSVDPNVPLIASLQGVGDIIPDGLPPQVLPPLSQWNSTTGDYIQRASTFYPIDTLAACSSSSTGTATPTITNIISASAFGGSSAIAPGTWIEIYGTELAPDTRGWGTSDFKGSNAPTSLDGVQVSINGEKAFISYIASNPGQINAQIPSDIPFGGQLQITVVNNGVNSNAYAVTVNGVEPGLLAPASFKVGGNQYVVALLPDGNYDLPSGAISGVASRPGKPGETIIMYGIGFGLVKPPWAAGNIAPANEALILPVQFLFGQTPAATSFAGLAPGLVGLYQFNVVVPPVADNNLLPVTFNVGGITGKQTLFVAVHQ